MHLSFPFFLIPILALANGASAAECYYQGGSTRCVDIESVRKFQYEYCRAWKGGCGVKSYKAANGYSAQFLRGGNFGSQQECLNATGDIINVCFGHKDGGTWSGSQFLVGVNFCA